MGGSEEVKCNDALGDNFVPEVKWEFWVAGAKFRNDVVFEGLYGPFC